MKNLTRPALLTALLAVITSVNAQVPQLSSLPSASTTIFLDFDGHKVEGTTWNYNGPIECGAATLSTAQITEIFNRVAEDYRPFNVNVTTDSTKFLAAPLNRRMRAILTVSSSWYGSAGGVAYVNSFSWGDDTPCFIFTQLLNNNVKYISEATAHEIGHTLGLRHQSAYDANCVKTSDYHYGQGSGEIGWAPIMGVGYYQNFTLWHNGPNSGGCNSYQNDLSVITSTANGISFRTDDHPNEFATTSNTSFTDNQFAIAGIIEKNDDKDLVRFTVSSAGHFTVEAVPYNVGTGNAGSDLDMQVQLVDETQQVIGTYNPGNILGSVIDTVLAAGNYFLVVEGKGNLYAPEYGSLGSYSLAVGFTPAPVLAVRKLELSGTLSDNRHQLDWLIDADEQVVKQLIEYSADGRNFSTLNEPGNISRTFSYLPAAPGTLQYRLNVRFNNGRQYYSNIISLSQTATNPKPKLLGNFITTKTLIVSSPGIYSYAVMGINGKVLHKGKLQQGHNNIDIPGLTKGIYMIRFNNDREQWTEKLVAQ